MKTVVEAEDKLKTIIPDISDFQKTVSEEDAKVKIINRVLIEILDWNPKDFKLESKHENGFSDYILSDRDKKTVLIEAKRLGIIQIDAARKEDVKYLKLSGSALKKNDEGISQAASYALPNGLSMAILTDGNSWIFFKPFIFGENYKLKEAVVFPSIQSIINNFNIFYDLLHKNQVRNRVYHRIFDELHENRNIVIDNFAPPFAEESILLSRKSELAFDLEKIFENFFDRITEDEELIYNCFVESQESKIAEFSLEKMTASILGNITKYDGSIDSQLALIVKTALAEENNDGRTVFIIGPTGSGKTTFVYRFFKRTLITDLRQRCLLININCLDFTGSEEGITSKLIERTISTLENLMYGESGPTWEQLQGLYHSEYQKQSTGLYARIYKRDKEEFKDKFTEFLEKKVAEDREGYLIRILYDAIKNRKMLPVFVIDNTDEFSLRFQEHVFQFSQSIKRNINHCLVIFPVTDKSAWRFSKTDIFGIYESKSFFLPTPSPREVFNKRIEFLKSKISSEDGEKKRYFLSKGIQVSIANIEAFASAIEDVFVQHDYTSKTVGEFANYNIRRTLLLAKRVLTSSEIKIDDLIKSYISNKPISTDFNKFMDALIKGDYEFFKESSDSPEILNIFTVDNKVKQSPLLKVRILKLLKSIDKIDSKIDERHLAVDSIVSYFDGLGCSEMSVYTVLKYMLQNQLVEAYDNTITDIGAEQKLAITHRGRVHLKLATSNSAFFYQMALVTPIRNEDAADRIKSIYRSNDNFFSKIKAIRSIFLEYLVQEDKTYCSRPEGEQSYENQTELLEDLLKFSNRKLDSLSELSETHGLLYSHNFKAEGVIAKIKWFDPKRHYGFVDVPELGESAFLHEERLVESGLSYLVEGEQIYCDIARATKGLTVSKIHDYELDDSVAKVAICKIIRLYEDRNYGFASFDGSHKNVYFNLQLLIEANEGSLEIGLTFKAEVVPDTTNRYFQVRRVLKFV